MSNLIYIDILDKVLDKKYWEKTRESYYYSGHDHCRSPYETNDDCGNCSGARCDTCEKIIVSEHYEFAIPVDDLESILRSIVPSIPDDAISEMVYWDGSYRRETSYRLSMPNDYILKDRYPDFYASLSE